MGKGDDNLNKLIDAIVEDAEVVIPQRAFILIAGLANDGSPIFSERWINLDDLDHAIDEYTKCADIAFVQQGLAIRQMIDCIEDQDDGLD